MPQLCFSTAARLAAKLLFYIESSFLCILSYNANTPLDDVGRNVAKIVHHAMLAGRSRCADYALGFVLVAFFDVNAALVIVAGALAGSVYSAVKGRRAANAAVEAASADIDADADNASDSVSEDDNKMSDEEKDDK